MKFLRNPEVSRLFAVCLVTSVCSCAAAFSFGEHYGFFTLAVCAVFVAVFFFYTFRRYRRISDFAADIDRILHGGCQIALEKYEEGELGILQSEVHKLVVRLSEQQQRLQNDKAYLADSLADISHQIRTPLTSINLLISFLAEPGITAERRMELSRELYELLSRIEWLITTLLKLSKIDAGTAGFRSETVSLGDLLNRATAPLLVPMELRDQTLRITSKGNVTCDVDWTCEAVTNVVKNCMEHTQEHGEIEISALDNVLYTEIVITDNGCGIAAEDLPHIFERFYKGKNSGEKSFGIGLALARMVITAQNGTVKAENRASGGARFTIRFYKGIV